MEMCYKLYNNTCDFSEERDLPFYNIGTTKSKLCGDYKIKYAKKDMTKTCLGTVHEQSCPHL